MATRQIIVTEIWELNTLLLATLNLATLSLQAGDMQAAGVTLARANEIYPAMKEAIAALPKPANGAAEGKRA